MNNQRLYKALIAPHSGDPSSRNREVVLNWLLVGSLALTAVAFTSELFSYFAAGHGYVLTRLLIIAGVLLFFGVLLALSRQRQWQHLPPFTLVAIFFLAALGVVAQWGILAPTGVLIFSLVIVMAGILLGARYSLYLALLTVLGLSGIEYAKPHLRPNLSWQKQPSSFGDVAGFTAIYGTLALVSWLFNRQMEIALRRAQRSEKALKRQRDLLEIKVEERTRELRAAQLEQVQQFYRFAELGHLSTALFHDLANHLASVSVDIEGLRKNRRSDILSRIQDNISYIDGVVRRVRQQIQGQNQAERFDVIDEVKEIIKILGYHSARTKVLVELRAPDTPIAFTGDLTRFRQVVINLLTNAIEAYRDLKVPSRKRIVEVSLERSGGQLQITVSDHGKGIRPQDQAKVFEPFYSTKNKGMGIGLFIVKRVTEKDFGGTINLTSGRTGTTFIVTLPLKPHGKR